MSIKILEDRIEFDNFSLVTSARGISVVEKESVTALAEIECKALLSSTYSFQGKEFGYISGGHTYNPTQPINYSKQIQKFPLVVAGGLLSFVGNLTNRVGFGVTGHNSSSFGYTVGGSIDVTPHFYIGSGSNPLAPVEPLSPFSDYGDLVAGKNKTSFSSDVTLQEGGNFYEYFRFAAGLSSQTHGYANGGVGQLLRTTPVPQAPAPTGPIYYVPILTSIRKFPFASDTNATLTRNVNIGGTTICGFSASDKGYGLGSSTTPGNFYKMPFSTDVVTSITMPAPLVAQFGSFSISSTTNGYYQVVNPNANIVQKFPYSTDLPTAAVGNLNTPQRYAATGISSIGHGIVVGGTGSTGFFDVPVHPQHGQSTLPVSYVVLTPVPISPTTPLPKTTIERFPFASDVNTIVCGDLGATFERFGAAGFQY